LFATGIGAACASLVFALARTPTESRIPDYYFVAGPAIAEGQNLVNLVLSDFRGLDTLVETLVVLVAALGALALLRGREIPVRSGDGKVER
jgi:multicomponent Na+:H+ antiporter subunit A